MTEPELEDRFQQRCVDGEKLLWVGRGKAGRSPGKWVIAVGTLFPVAVLGPVIYFDTHSGITALTVFTAVIPLSLLVAWLGLRFRRGSESSLQVVTGYAVTDRRVMRDRLFATATFRKTTSNSVTSMSLQDLSPGLDQTTSDTGTIRLLRAKTLTSFDIANISNTYEVNSILADAIARCPRSMRFMSNPTLNEILDSRLDPGERIVASQRPNFLTRMKRGAVTFLPHSITMAMPFLTSSAAHPGQFFSAGLLVCGGVVAGIARAASGSGVPLYAVTNRRVVVMRLTKGEVEFSETPLHTIRYTQALGMNLYCGVFDRNESVLQDLPRPKDLLAAIVANAPNVETGRTVTVKSSVAARLAAARNMESMDR